MYTKVVLISIIFVDIVCRLCDIHMQRNHTIHVNHAIAISARDHIPPIDLVIPVLDPVRVSAKVTKPLSLRYQNKGRPINKIKKRPIYSTSKRRAVRLRPIKRAGRGGGGGGGGGAVRVKLRAKKKKYFRQKGPGVATPTPCIRRPWESKHWNEYTKQHITEHSWQRKKN